MEVRDKELPVLLTRVPEFCWTELKDLKDLMEQDPYSMLV